jgi:hypothetical protein
VTPCPFLSTYYDSKNSIIELSSLNNVCQFPLLKYYFWITDGPKPCAGLSNTLFGLPMAQNLVRGCQILFLDYQWPKTLCEVCQMLFLDYQWPKILCEVCQMLFLDYQWPKILCEVCQLLFLDYQWPKTLCGVCQILFLDYRLPKTLCGVVKYSFWIMDGPNLLHIPNKTAIGHIPNWTLNKRILHNLVHNLSATILQE